LRTDLNELINDPDYKKLLDFYQDAEFEKCWELVKKLEERYPENQEILVFKDDLLLKSSFKNSMSSNKKEERQEKKKKIYKVGLFAIVTTTILLAVFLFAYFLIGLSTQTKKFEEDYLQLTSLEYQAEQLLGCGNPQAAAKIIEEMRMINAEYEKLPILMAETEELLQLEEKYNNAIVLAQQEKRIEALEIYKAIEAEHPNMWDVQYQINSLETGFEIESSLDEGSREFITENWDGVIEAYERALDLDPNLNDPLMIEQLIQGYLNKIISLLEDKSTTIEDIQNAENYYRKAVSLVSQSKAFTSERESLQKASSDLLQLKFSQASKNTLGDRNQTSISVAEAVSYLRKASNLDPENKALNADLKNAEYYQMAFKNFMNMNWDQTITYLNALLSNDPNYANGNANILLFDAYYALGKQYASLGLYLDAIKVLEQAEMIAWEDSNNLLKLFQVQIFLGEIFGKLNNYQDAVSYYQYALDTIDANKKLAAFPDLLKILSDANVQMAYLNYDNAYQSYQELVKNIDVFFSRSEVKIEDGVCLAFFAADNLSTVDAIIKENNLPANMNVTFGRELIVPIIEK
jgi:tetratricopeptide (TPR) repeat protein